MDRNLFNQIQNIIDYIEENIYENIKTSDLTKLIYMSKSSFYNICTLVLGMPIKRYIRYRKLSRSAFDLLYSNNSITDIAHKYGYNSATSYSRSFKQLYGLSPQHYKDKGVYKCAYPRVVLINKSKGENYMHKLEVNVETLQATLNNKTSGYLLDVDIDHFQSINNKFGTDTGDIVIKHIKEVINKVLKQANINSRAIRIHGDEYAIVLDNYEEIKIESICSKILLTVKEGLRTSSQLIPLSVSIGVCKIASDSNNELLGLAKSAMLSAKKDGKDRFKFA